jgi:hypothetical protein
VKRIAGVILAIAVLAGGAFTAQLWMVPGGSSPGFLAALQMDEFTISEPAGIMLASAALFGFTTLLRRHRDSRQAVLRVKKPKWQVLSGAGGNFKEVI